jgi:hypothetical protein
VTVSETNTVELLSSSFFFTLTILETIPFVVEIPEEEYIPEEEPEVEKEHVGVEVQNVVIDELGFV